MIELREEADGRLSRGYGGDTLNTAIYLARLGIAGRLRDRARRRQLERRADRSLGCGGRRHRPGSAPAGPPAGSLHHSDGCERRAPVFLLARHAQPRACCSRRRKPRTIVAALSAYDLDLPLGHLPVALRRQRARAPVRRLLAKRAPTAGAWPSTPISARAAGPIGRSREQPSAQAFACADIILASTEDLDLLFGGDGADEVLAFSDRAEIVLKHPDLTCRVLTQGEEISCRASLRRTLSTRPRRATVSRRLISHARLSGQDPRGGGPGRPSPRRSGRALSRRDHSARGYATNALASTPLKELLA